MKRLIITESEKKHILGLYEGVECRPEDTEIYNNLVNNIYPTQLNIAIKWWEDWLKNPITKDKFTQNNPDIQDPNKIFEGYFSLLKNIKIVPYGLCTKLKSNEHYAYVTNSSPIIYVNTTHTKLDAQSIAEIFVHEVQHLLYFYQPMLKEESFKRLKIYLILPKDRLIKQLIISQVFYKFLWNRLKKYISTLQNKLKLKKI